MKRFLKKNQYQLNAREQETLWHGIQEQTGRRAPSPRRPRRFVMPVFGMTAVTAAVLMAAIWFHNQDAPQKIANQVRNENPRVDYGEVAAARELILPALPEPARTEIVEPTEKMEPALTEAPAVGLAGKGKVVEGTPVRDDKKDVDAPVDTKPQVPITVDPPVEPKTVTEHTVSSETFEKFSIESVRDALSKQAEAVSREGEVYVRGGRTGETSFQMDGVKGADTEALTRSHAIAGVPEKVNGTPPTRPGSVTGGTTPPNGETFELMYFEHAGVNPFVATEEDALSTFAVDVDNASYTLTRSYLERGALPPKDAVRVEEFVNFFSGDYPEQTKDVFTIHTDGAPSRFGSGYQLLRVGLKGMAVSAENRKPAILIFVIDVSGSMATENRLGLVKQSLHVLLDELGEGDRVGIVTYGNRGLVRLEPTDISRRQTIESVIDALGPSGATNACEGLEMAYDLARRNYDAGLINRLILCSDGVANLGGATRAEEMLAQVRRSSDEGITLSTIGFGMGNYNDVLMEKLADQGDGNYNYVDKLDEAERVFRENLTGLLQTIAREVKIQVEFDPRRVQRWRLLGYENRDVADRDFRNDSVDAGEVGAGHEVTAFYELKLVDDGSRFPANLDDESDYREPADLGTVRVRFEHPSHDTARAGQVEEIAHRIKLGDLKKDFSQASQALRLQAVAAEFAEILRGSYWAKESRLADLVPVADGLAKELAGDAKASELAHLIRQAADLQAARDAREKEIQPRD